MSIKYSSNTAIKSIIKSPALSFNLNAQGDGSGVLEIRIKTNVAGTLYVTGGAKLYDNVACTIGESTSKSIATGGDLTYGYFLYCKMSSGNGKLNFSNKHLTQLVFNESSVNCPMPGGDISHWIKSQVFVGHHRFFGDLTNLLEARYIQGGGGCWFTGDVSNNTVIENLQSTEATDVRNNWTGNLSNKPNLSYLEVGGYATPYGNLIAATNPKLYVVVSYSYYQNWDVTLDGLTYLYYFETKDDFAQSRVRVTINDLSLCTALDFINLTHQNLGTATANSILAFFWANRNSAKYSSASGYRGIHLSGIAAPTGQGLVDKANLQAYRSPDNAGTAPLWNVTTN